MCLVGISEDDKEEDAVYCATKIANLRLFDGVKDDKPRPWSQSVSDIHGELLCVSQFTLMAQTKKGTKPDFHRAMRAADAEKFYNSFLDMLRVRLGGKEGDEGKNRVKNGAFGAMMAVSLVNDGPVTIVVDSRVV
jgi:D-tyrosyl-tRNA(Tyr) deacylase